MKKGKVMLTRTRVLRTVCIGIVVSMTLTWVACTQDEVVQPTVPLEVVDEAAQATCEELSVGYCEHLFECEPDYALLVFDVTADTECATTAPDACQLLPTEPHAAQCAPATDFSEARVIDCFASMTEASCGQLDPSRWSGPCAELIDSLQCVGGNQACAPCGQGFHCEFAIGECMEDTCGGELCAPGQVCDEDQCRDRSCEDVTCKPGQVCNPNVLLCEGLPEDTGLVLTPAPGSVDQPVTLEVRVTSAEAFEDDFDIVVGDLDNNRPVEGELLLSDEDRTALFLPDELLQYDTGYFAAVRNDGDSYLSTFRTVAAGAPVALEGNLTTGGEAQSWLVTDMVVVSPAGEAGDLVAGALDMFGTLVVPIDADIDENGDGTLVLAAMGAENLDDDGVHEANLVGESFLGEGVVSGGAFVVDGSTTIDIWGEHSVSADPLRFSGQLSLDGDENVLIEDLKVSALIGSCAEAIAGFGAVEWDTAAFITILEALCGDDDEIFFEAGLEVEYNEMPAVTFAQEVAGRVLTVSLDPALPLSSRWVNPTAATLIALEDGVLIYSSRNHLETVSYPMAATNCDDGEPCVLDTVVFDVPALDAGVYTLDVYVGAYGFSYLYTVPE